jgi:hypothetical protein
VRTLKRASCAIVSVLEYNVPWCQYDSKRPVQLTRLRHRPACWTGAASIVDNPCAIHSIKTLCWGTWTRIETVFAMEDAVSRSERVTRHSFTASAGRHVLAKPWVPGASGC